MTLIYVSINANCLGNIGANKGLPLLAGLLNTPSITSITNNENSNTQFILEGNDPLYKYSMHYDFYEKEVREKLQQQGDNLTGKNVTIAIASDGIDITHEDLYDPENPDKVTSIDYGYTENKIRGTKIAGLIASLPNDKGILGMAPDTKIIGYNIENGTENDFIDSLTRDKGKIQVYVGYYGYDKNPDPTMIKPYSPISDKYNFISILEDTTINEINNGKTGTIYLFPSYIKNSSEIFERQNNGKTEYTIYFDNADANYNFLLTQVPFVNPICSIGRYRTILNQKYYILTDSQLVPETTQGANVFVCGISNLYSESRFEPYMNLIIDRIFYQKYPTEWSITKKYIEYTKTILPTSSNNGNLFESYNWEYSTTDLSLSYVASAVSLILEAYPEATWRLIRYILFQTARYTELISTEFEGNTIIEKADCGYEARGETNPNEFDCWYYYVIEKNTKNYNKENIRYSLRHGFGLVDIQQAIKLAKEYNSYKFQFSPLITYKLLYIPCPDLVNIDNTSFKSCSFNVSTDAKYIEGVQFIITLDTDNYADLYISVQSPEGTLIPIKNITYCYKDTDGNGVKDTKEVCNFGKQTNATFYYGINAFMDENSNGTWKIYAKTKTGTKTTIKDIDIIIYGRKFY